MSKEIVYTQNAPSPIGPYSQGIKAGNILFISGQLALDPDNGEFINENITEETHAVMKNLDAILQAAGYGFNDVVKCTIYVKNLEDFSIVNDAYGQYFKKNPPARETVEVSRLPKDAHVEISCIAVKNESF